MTSPTFQTSAPVAIVLHGPPGAGKTQTISELCGRHTSGTVRVVSLDDGWLASGPQAHTFRYRPGQDRYRELREATEPVLLIELACGEPEDLTFPGATRRPDEWVDVLRQAGRRLFVFLLWTDWDDAVQRLTDRHFHRPHGRRLFGLWEQLGVYALYEHRSVIVTFPESVEEVAVLVRDRSSADVADEIVAQVNRPCS
jgi:hypothetical protein